MITVQALQVFDILQDQYGAPYFPEAWKLELFNAAQFEVLNRMIPDSLGGVVNFEFDQNVMENLRPLFFTVSVGQDGGGGISYSSINTALQTASSDVTATVFKVIAVSFTNSNSIVAPAKFVKYNNAKAFNDNVFKRATTDSFQYTYYGFGLQFFPTAAGTSFNITVLKNPRVLATSGIGANPDWSDYVMYQVIYQALKLAGIAVSGTEEIQNLVSSGIQSAQ